MSFKIIFIIFYDFYICHLLFIDSFEVVLAITYMIFFCYYVIIKVNYFNAGIKASIYR